MGSVPKGRQARNQDLVDLPVSNELEAQLTRRAKRRGISVTEYLDVLVAREQARKVRFVMRVMKTRIPPNPDPVFRGLLQAVRQQQKGGR